MSPKTAADPHEGHGSCGIQPGRAEAVAGLMVNNVLTKCAVIVAVLTLALSPVPASTLSAGVKRARGGRGGGNGRRPPAEGVSGAGANPPDPPAGDDDDDGGDGGDGSGGGGDGCGNGGGNGGGGDGSGGGGDGGGDLPPPPVGNFEEVDGDDDDYVDEEGDDDAADAEADPRPNRAYRSLFDLRQVYKVNRVLPRIRRFNLPTTRDPRLAYPCPFPVSGDMLYERLEARLHGKAANQLACVYVTCAWLQSMHNRFLDAELRKERTFKTVSAFDKGSRLALHQLDALVSARLKINLRSAPTMRPGLRRCVRWCLGLPPPTTCTARPLSSSRRPRRPPSSAKPVGGTASAARRASSPTRGTSRPAAEVPRARQPLRRLPRRPPPPPQAAGTSGVSDSPAARRKRRAGATRSLPGESAAPKASRRLRRPPKWRREQDAKDAAEDDAATSESPLRTLRAAEAAWLSVGASPWAVRTILYGLGIPWLRRPPSTLAAGYRMPKNAKDWSKTEVGRWVAAGFVGRLYAATCAAFPCVYPTFVVHGGNARLVVDLGRINCCIGPRRFQYKHLQSFLPSLRPGDHLVS